jgi:hypothetical protein
LEGDLEAFHHPIHGPAFPEGALELSQKFQEKPVLQEPIPTVSGA